MIYPSSKIKTNFNWVGQEKREYNLKIKRQIEENRQKIVSEIFRLRSIKKGNGRVLSVRDIEDITGISKSTIAEILKDGTCNAKHFAKHLII